MKKLIFSGIICFLLGSIATSEIIRVVGNNQPKTIVVNNYTEKQCLEAGKEQLPKIAKPQSSGNTNARLTYKVKIDGTKTLKQLIKDGHYNWHSDALTDKNFPIKDKSKREAVIELFRFAPSFDLSTNEILMAMEKDGYRPATTEELLALGNNFPEMIKEFKVIALGSVLDMDNFLMMPSLGHTSFGRGADISFQPDNYGWPTLYRFAALRK